MKKSLCGFAMSVMLVTVFGAAQGFAEDKDRKEKMRVIVAEKRESDKSANRGTQQGHTRDRKTQR